VPYSSEDAARAALDDKSIGAYFILPSSYLNDGQIRIYSYTGIPGALKDTIKVLLKQNVTRQFGADIPLERLEEPVNLTIKVTDSGRTLTEANIPVLIFMPMIFALLFLMSSGVTSSFLMNGIVEEKTNRIMEILITSITPMQMLLGKVIGLGLLGLTQMLVWGTALVVIITAGQSLPFLRGIAVPWDMMVIFMAYFVLSYFLLAGLMAGIGAVAGSEQESRQLSSVISLIWTIPFFFIIAFFNDSNGTIPTIMTFIPFTAPMTVMLRMGLGSVPLWQIGISLALLAVATIGTVWVSARIFRWGLLRYGKRVSLRGLLRAVRQSQVETVTARSPQEA
jgi:ABC-2 type transport system permease protein